MNDQLIILLYNKFNMAKPSTPRRGYNKPQKSRQRLPCRSSDAEALHHRWFSFGVTARSFEGSRWRWSGLHVQSVYPGDGGYPRSIIAGLYAGEGESFLSFTNAALASGKRRLSQFLLRRFFVTESGGLQSSALPSWNPMSFGLW
ncbi:unnamed protein product [Brassica oleracea]